MIKALHWEKREEGVVGKGCALPPIDYSNLLQHHTYSTGRSTVCHWFNLAMSLKAGPQVPLRTAYVMLVFLVEFISSSISRGTDIQQTTVSRDIMS